MASHLLQIAGLLPCYHRVSLCPQGKGLPGAQCRIAVAKQHLELRMRCYSVTWLATRLRVTTDAISSYKKDVLSKHSIVL